MIGTKEWKKQTSESIDLLKKQNSDLNFNHNPCGGCNACHQMTSIHNKAGSPIWNGTNDGEKGTNLQRPCATNFFQRHLGNNYLQSMAGGQHAIRQTIQRKCNCGGSCGGCVEEEEKSGRIQTKLVVGPANDVYEKEADRVAEQIMRMPDSLIQTENDQPHTGINIQRISTSNNSTQESAPNIQLSESGGQALLPSTRQFMEPRFGVDFGHVRLHMDDDAHQKASQIQARAFTYGNHIWLGRGESEENKQLMSHELSHVVQQGAVISTNRVNNMHVPQVQRARLPCTSRKTIDVYPVNLPGSTRSIYDDLPTINSVLCQCGIEINVTSGESWDTNVLDLDPPTGVLNASGATPSRELSQMLSHRPGGNVIHAYYVPALQGPLAEAVASSRFTPPLPDALIVGNGAGAVPIVAAHELGHVLLDDGSHRDSNPDNLMASGSVNTGAGELEQDQCNRMP